MTRLLTTKTTNLFPYYSSAAPHLFFTRWLSSIPAWSKIPQLQLLILTLTESPLKFFPWEIEEPADRDPSIEAWFFLGVLIFWGLMYIIRNWPEKPDKKRIFRASVRGHFLMTWKTPPDFPAYLVPILLFEEQIKSPEGNSRFEMGWKDYQINPTHPNWAIQVVAVADYLRERAKKRPLAK